MSALGILAYLGLAAVSLDPFGGMVAAAALARGASRAALLTLLVTYAAAITAAILALHPILRWLGHLLAPVLAAHLTWSIAQLALAVALLALGGHQLRASLRPAAQRDEPARTRPLALAGAALLLAATSMPDPPFIAAVGIATTLHPLAEGVALLVLWNAIYQGPMLLIAGAGVLGFGPPVARWWDALVTRRRVLLQRAVALALGAGGILAGIDAAFALSDGTFPWLHLLMDA